MPARDVVFAVEEGFEYGIFVVAGAVVAESTTVGVDQLLYLGTNRRNLRIRSQHGGRVIMLGGEPFAEDIVMWWNFIGRSHQEIVEFRSAWEGRDPRFPPVVSRSEKMRRRRCRPSGSSHVRAGACPSESGAGLAGDRIPLERSRADTYRVRAYRGAADVISKLSDEERREHQEHATWAKVPGVGPKTATVITQAMGGQVPEYLQKLREEKQPLVEAGSACVPRSRAISTVTPRGPMGAVRLRK